MYVNAQRVLTTALISGLTFAASALANVDLAFQPALQAAIVGNVVEIHLFAASDDVGTHPVQTIEVILQWDPDYLELLGVDHGLAGHAWHMAGFPLDPDGLNAGVVTPWTDVPANDGNAFYVALAAVDDPAPVPPSPGLLVTTIRFRALEPVDLTSLSMLASYGTQSHTRVLAASPPNTDVTGNISSTAGVVIGAGSRSRLTLEIESDCVTDEIVEVALWMRDLTQFATGFQAFLSYDDDLLQFQSGLSEYTPLPFTGHVTGMGDAEVQPGQLNLNGFTYGAGTDLDSLLAILRFTAVGECDWTSVDFRQVVGFQSELSYAGTPIPTDLFNSPDFQSDLSGPVIDGLQVANVEMDETCAASLSFTATVTDNCCLNDAEIVVDLRLLGDNAELGTPSYSVADGIVMGSIPISNLTSCPGEVQLTVFAADCCGNASGTPATTPDEGRWSESFAGGGGGAIGNVIHAWDSGSGVQWELSGPTLSDVTLLTDTVDVEGNGERVYASIYLGGELIVDADLWGGSDMQTAAVVQHRHLTHQIFVDGDVDWSASWTEIQTYATAPYGPGLIVTGTASFSGQGAAPPSGYPPFLGNSENGGHWGSVTNLELTVASVAIGTAADALPPSAVCRDPFTVQLDGDGLASIIPADVDGGSSDNCGEIMLVSAEPAVFSCEDVGDATVTLTVADTCGNTATCDTNVTIEDQVPPIARCRNITVQLNETGEAHIAAAQIDNGSSDACGIESISVEPAGFTCDDLGEYSVTLTVTDVNGNTSICTATVTVEDDMDPSITCPPDITVDTDAEMCYATGVNLGTPTTEDNCGIANVSNDAPAQFPLGLTNVTWTVLDIAGNYATCEQMVTVTDSIAPTIACPSDIEIGADPEQCYATNVDLGEPVTDDNCGVTDITNNAPDQFPLGDTTVTWTATDGAGNSATCEQIVSVVDNQDPAIECPPDVEVGVDPGTCFATNVVLGTPETSDNCIVANVSNDAPDLYPVGLTLVTWTVLDGAGNSASCEQNVNVIENEPPTITCPADIEVSADADECHATGVELGTPVTDDNCSDVTVTNNAPPVYPVGETIVTWTATDAASNTASCDQTVTVLDDQPPTIHGCPGDIYVDPPAGGCSAAITWPPLTVEDNCGIQSFSSNLIPGTLFTGTTTVIYTAVDVNGNAATCTFDVVVSGYNKFAVDVQLQGLLYDPNPGVPGDTIDRCIVFTFYGCDDPVVLEKEMTFNVDQGDPFHGYGSAIFEDLECGDYDCVTAEDPLHSLTVRLDRGAGGLYVNAQNQYAAAFTDEYQLLSGDLHQDEPRDRIDSVDYNLFMAEWGWTGDRNTACDTSGPHADFNGDGLVTTADFTFIQINFLRLGDPSCCTPAMIETDVGPVRDLSVAVLSQTGLGFLAVGDLNNDGWLNMDDVTAFTTGASPVPPESHAQNSPDKASSATDR